MLPVVAGPSVIVFLELVALGCVALFLWPRDMGEGGGFWASLVIAGVLSAVAGEFQYFGWGYILEPWIDSSRFGVAYANLRQRNHFATLLALCFLCLLYWTYLLTSETRRFSGWVGSLPCLVLVVVGVLVAAGAALSTSRTGLVQWLLVALCMEWAVLQGVLNGRWALIWLMRWCVFWYFATLWLGPRLLAMRAPEVGEALLDRIWTPIDCSSRLVLWSNVWELVLQKPWWGWGWGELDYAHFSTLFANERFCALVDNAHNLPLHLAVELGGVVALGVLSALGYWVWRGRPWNERNPERLLAWGILGLIAIHSMLEYPLWYGPFQLAVFWCVWVLWSPGQGLAQAGAPVALGLRGSMRQMRIGGAALLLGFTSVLAWDYARVSQVYRPVAERWALLGLPQRSVFFQDYLDFARFTTTELSAENAAEMVVLGQRMLHFSPEARVVVKLLEAAQGAGRDDLHQWLLPRFEAAYPAEYAAWRARQAP